MNGATGRFYMHSQDPIRDSLMYIINRVMSQRHILGNLWPQDSPAKDMMEHPGLSVLYACQPKSIYSPAVMIR